MMLSSAFADGPFQWDGEINDKTERIFYEQTCKNKLTLINFEKVHSNY